MLTKRTLDKASFIEEVTIHKKNAIRDFKAPKKQKTKKCRTINNAIWNKGCYFREKKLSRNVQL